MMPWEQEWHVDAERYNDIRNNDGPAGRTLWTNMDATDGERQLAAAAPKMARALMSLIDSFPPAGSEEEDEALEFARKALREAGVIP